MPVERRTRHDRLGRRPRQLAAELLLDGGQEFFDTHGVDHIFHPRLERDWCGRRVDENPHDGVGDLGGVRRLDDDPGISGEILVTGDAADRQTKPDARLDTETVLHLDRRKGDIVGVFKHRNLAGAVKGDIELARQSGTASGR